MNHRAQMHTSGVVGMCASVLFLGALFIEYAFGLFSPGDSSALYYFDQALFFIASSKASISSLLSCYLSSLLTKSQPC